MGLDESLVGKVYKTTLNKEKYNFNALYVNDEKAIMARTRNYDEDPRCPAYNGEYLYSAGGGIWVHAPEAEFSSNPSYDEQTDRTEYKVGAITMINTNNMTVINTKIHNTGLWGNVEGQSV